ncbi:MAG: YidC/Oxa1 family insertase periplasmic-domain containing protein [Bdellovibrionales bacterium]|nr:YidC/Oxa1 family insertase periplasmic-domain containing protein [Bdellovibrionales bacterium]
MKEKENFLDKNTLIAVSLVFMTWLLWDSYMRKKYPVGKSPITQENTAQAGRKERQRDNILKKTSDNEKNNIDASSFSETESSKKFLKEQTLSFKSDNLSFDISSKGMGLKNLVLNKIFDRKGQAIWLFLDGEKLAFETRLDEREFNPLYFDIKPVSPYSWEGVAVWREIKIKKKLSVKPSLFLMETQIEVIGNIPPQFGISTVLSQKPKKQGPSQSFFSFLTLPDFVSFFVSSSKGWEYVPLDSNSSSSPSENVKTFSAVKVAALGDKYFGQAWMEKESDVLPQFKIEKEIGWIRHLVLNPKKDFKVSYKIFIGPKDLALLKKDHPSLIHWVDFGWFSALSRGILQILYFFYSLVGNWGGAIILLTLLVRIILFPFVLSSHRSMELMKKVHPEIQKIREKFKDNPQRMNQEVMAVMKAYRANPLGGCLPLLLQLPVFWSLWKALSNSYSLYQAPFIFWIRDLSWKDPYYILPVLMGLVMFVQQKLSPVTLNKEMLRVMQVMPIFMSLFMINLPSGLVLYMLVSTVFGLVQQVYLNKKGDLETSALLQNSKKLKSTKGGRDV